MDLNKKYAAHQKAVMAAAIAPSGLLRKIQLDKAAVIATLIQSHQVKLGAAAACAWSSSKRGCA